jgi:heme oxygenase
MNPKPGSATTGHGPVTSRLRAATWPLHRQAERSALMRQLLAGEFDHEVYVSLLSSLHVIYTALESALDRCAHHPRVSGVVDPALYRGAALTCDLLALAGGRPPQPATVARGYAARIDALVSRAPVRLLGHAYVRYLGDLNGGRVLARSVARALRDRAALAFYDFGSAAQVAARVMALRTALDSAALGPDETEQLVDEAVWAFGAHIALFDELAAAPRTAAAPKARRCG